jgi:hypothetical protein
VVSTGLAVHCIAFADDGVPQVPWMRPNDVVGESRIVENEMGFDVRDPEFTRRTRRFGWTFDCGVAARLLLTLVSSATSGTREGDDAQGCDGRPHGIGCGGRRLKVRAGPRWRNHRTYMGAVERGETNISLDNLERIARALNMSARLHQ